MRMYVGKEEQGEKIDSVVPYPSTPNSGYETTRDAARLEQEVEKKQARLTSSR